VPVIEALLDNFPFSICGFHADNGSEYINHRVARLLEKLRIVFTKSRPRHSNDNGLAETKNGAVVRKCFGYSHIPQRFATQINAFCAAHPKPYLNFHRPCLFAEDTIDAKGKVKKRYPQRLVMTPLETGLAARSRHLSQTRYYPGPTPGRGHTTDRQRRRPATQRSETAAVSIHPPPIQVRRLMTQSPTSSRLKPLLELTAYESSARDATVRSVLASRARESQGGRLRGLNRPLAAPVGAAHEHHAPVQRLTTPVSPAYRLDRLAHYVRGWMANRQEADSYTPRCPQGEGHGRPE